MISKRYGRLASGLVLGALAPCGLADVVDVANSVRLTSCRQTAADAGQLYPHPQLDAAARHIARGADLETATAESGYYAKVSASIRLETAKGDIGIAQLLTERFCAFVADPDFREIGVFQRGEETWIVFATPFVPPESVDARQLNERVLELINQARSQPRRCGRTTFAAAMPLQPDPALERAALAHARDMAARGRLGHDGSDESMPGDRVSREGYTWTVVAENVAAGQTSAEEVVRTWIASAGHCENLMSPDFRQTGIAHAVNRDAAKGTYWVEVFAAR